MARSTFALAVCALCVASFVVNAAARPVPVALKATASRALRGANAANMATQRGIDTDLMSSYSAMQTSNAIQLAAGSDDPAATAYVTQAGAMSARSVAPYGAYGYGMGPYGGFGWGKKH